MTVCSIYTQEFLLKQHRAVVLGIGATIDGLTLLFAALYFLYVTKDWKYWYYGVSVLQIIVIIGLFWLPESPDFLFAKGRFAESRDVILRIAKFNGRGDVVTPDVICFGGHRPEHYYRGVTRNEDIGVSI